MTNTSNLFITVIVTLVLATSSSLSQTMSQFFKYEGVEALVGLAHPFSTYNSGKYSIYKDKIIIEIEYEEGSTYLILFRNGSFFYRH